MEAGCEGREKVLQKKCTDFCLQSFTRIDVQEKKNPATIGFQDQLVELTVGKCSFASKSSIFVLEFVKILRHKETVPHLFLYLGWMRDSFGITETRTTALG